MNAKQIFWSGLKAFIPLALTVAIVFWFIRSVDHFFGAILLWILPQWMVFKGMGIIVGIGFIFLLGILVNAWLIENLYKWLDKLVKKIPIIKSIYNAIQELVSFFDKDKSTEQQTVLIDTPMGKMIGFVTRETIQDLPFGDNPSDSVLVYIPLSYQIGGLMIAMPRSQLQIIDWPMDTAMSFVLTAGMTKAADKEI